jgi:two-component system response regulator HydG
VLVRAKDYDDGSGAETIDATGFQTSLDIDSTGHEIIEQFERLDTRCGSLASAQAELVRRTCSYLNAERGFIARFTSLEDGEFTEIANFGLTAGDNIQFTDENLIERLLRLEPVQDRNALFVPIRAVDGVPGFFCFDRRSATAHQFAAEQVNFLRRIAEIVTDWNSSASLSDLGDATDQPIAWPEGLIGTGPLMKSLRQNIAVAAKTKKNVLVSGETGTGKQLVAEALHFLACGPSRPFIDRECRAIPESLAETTLFGKEKGAYTGAATDTKGLFELADKGTLFLDDIQKLPDAVRPMLYKVLLDRRVVRVGGSVPRPVDVFVVAAIETEPDADDDAGFARAFTERFETKIKVPPLRKRREDIPLLAFHFLDGCAARERKRTRSISHRALDLLMKHDWPGNVRELRNCIENAVRQDIEIILSSDLPPTITEKAPPNPSQKNGEQATFVPRTLAEIEKAAIQATLNATGGNIAKSARILKISDMGLRLKMKAYDIRRHQT